MGDDRHRAIAHFMAENGWDPYWLPVPRWYNRVKETAAQGEHHAEPGKSPLPVHHLHHRILLPRHRQERGADDPHLPRGRLRRVRGLVEHDGRTAGQGSGGPGRPHPGSRAGRRHLPPAVPRSGAPRRRHPLRGGPAQGRAVDEAQHRPGGAAGRHHRHRPPHHAERLPGGGGRDRPADGCAGQDPGSHAAPRRAVRVPPGHGEHAAQHGRPAGLHHRSPRADPRAPRPPQPGLLLRHRPRPGLARGEGHGASSASWANG